MSKLFSLFLIFILFGSLMPHVKADENVWDEDPLNITWSTASNAIVFDTNRDGIADQLYTYSISGTTRSITKVLGTGAAGTSSATSPTTGSINMVIPDGTKAYFGSGTAVGTYCKVYASTVDVLTGTGVGNALNNTISGGIATLRLVNVWAGFSEEPVVTNGCYQGSANASFVVKNSTNTWASKTAAGIGDFTYWAGAYGSAVTASDASYQWIDGQRQSYTLGTAPSVTTNWGSGWFGGTWFLFNPQEGTNTPTKRNIASGGASVSTVPIDGFVQLYADGLVFPTGKKLLYNPLYWKSMLSAEPADKMDVLVRLHYKILDPTLTSDVIRFKFRTGSSDYIMYVSGANVKYALASTIDLSNRAVTHYTIDTHSPILQSLGVDSTFPGYHLTLVNQDAASSAKTFGSFSLLSGYQAKPGSTTARVLDPEVTNNTDHVSWYGWVLGSNSSQTTLTANIKNAPLPQGVNIQSNAVTSSLAKPTFQISAEAFPHGLVFNNNGTQLIHGGQTLDSAISWTLTTPYYMANANFNYLKRFSFTSQDTIPIGIQFNNDGLKMYMSGDTNNKIYQYTLTTPYDYTTASYASKSLTTTTQTGSPYSFNFKPDGTKVIVGGLGSATLFSYTLSTPWDISTATYDSISFDMPYAAFWGFVFNSNGTKAIWIDNGVDEIGSITCTTGWLLSSCSEDATHFSTSSYITGLTGLVVSPNGERLIITGNAPERWFINFRMSTPWDISTLQEDTLNYTWTLDHMAADRSYAIDLPASFCNNWQVRDLSEYDQNWLDLGELCNVGTMPKTIAYLSDLAFTFWTLPWGTSHTYDQDSTTLETKVRHSVPYSYFVDVYDKDSVLVDSQEYTVSSGSELDIQDVDTSSIDLPARVIIMDNTNSTLYTATIGYPSYLSGVVAFFNQYFEIDGFNLLYMMPIVFAAMFTRNSVAIGTGMTVAFIATLAWLGVIVIAEPILYLMIFVTVLGMIAYRMLYY